jgi:hypothetical membrane protein
MIIKQESNRSIGAILWLINLQYFIVQGIVASAWTKSNGYSWGHDTISDLGNTQCGQYGARAVCSPLHLAMNLSFIVVGITILSGAVLLGREARAGFAGRLGFGCMAVAGVGAILVGLFPENSVSALHIAGATMSFLLGNAGMILIGINLERLPKTLRIYTILSGVVALIALVFFLQKTYVGLDIGGMERIVSYPQTIWMIVFGTYWLRSRREDSTD